MMQEPNKIDLQNDETLVVDFTGKVEFLDNVKANIICGVDRKLEEITKDIRSYQPIKVYLIGAPDGAEKLLKLSTGVEQIYLMSTLDSCLE